MKKKIRRFGFCAGEMPCRTVLFSIGLFITVILGWQDGRPGMLTYAACLLALLIFVVFGGYAIWTTMIVRKIRMIGMPARGRELRAIYTGRLSAIGLMSFIACQPLPLAFGEIESLILSAALILIVVDYKFVFVFHKSL